MKTTLPRPITAHRLTEPATSADPLSIPIVRRVVLPWPQSTGPLYKGRNTTRVLTEDGVAYIDLLTTMMDNVKPWQEIRSLYIDLYPPSIVKPYKHKYDVCDCIIDRAHKLLMWHGDTLESACCNTESAIPQGAVILYPRKSLKHVDIYYR